MSTQQLATSDGIAINECQNSNARLTNSSKVTMMMTDNACAAYDTNLLKFENLIITVIKTRK